MTPLAQKILAGDAEAAQAAEARLTEGAETAESSDLRKALVQHYTRQTRRRQDRGASHLERDFEAALRHMRPLYAAAPDDPGVGIRFFSLLVDSGRQDEALLYVEPRLPGAAAVSPSYEFNLLGIAARIYYARGDFARTEDLLERIIARALEMFGADVSGERSRFLGSAVARLARVRINRGAPERAVTLIEQFPHKITHEFLGRTLNRAKALLAEGLPSARPEAYPVDLDRLTVACVKHGDKYGPDYVNRLYAMVRRHLPGNWRFVCYTDDPKGLAPEIGVVDISKAPVSGWWAKLALFDPRIPLADPTIFYLDLDTIVVGDLSFIKGLKVGFQILEHPDSPTFNSSVMLFDRAFAAPVSQKIRRQDIVRLVGDQDWIEETMPTLDTLPREMIRLYRGLDPELTPAGLAETGARIVTFPSSPKPHEVKGGWVAEHWR